LFDGSILFQKNENMMKDSKYAQKKETRERSHIMGMAILAKPRLPGEK
jgi:hypothetical protein